MLLFVSAGLLLVSLCAPWAYAIEAFTWEDTVVSGWEWFGAAGDAAFLLAIAALALAAVLRAAGARVAPALLAVCAVAVVATTGAVVLDGLWTKSIAMYDPFPLTGTRHAPSSGGGPPLAIAALVLAPAGLLGARRPAQRSLGVRGFALLVAAALLGAATFARWTWTVSDEPGNAWAIYEWGDVAVALIASAIALAALVRPSRALWALPVGCVLVPFMDLGIALSGPGRFHEPLAVEGDPVGIGVAVALGALALAAWALARRDDVTAARRRAP